MTYPLHKSEARYINIRDCEYCKTSNIYQQCYKCIDWKLPLQEKPSYK